MSYKQQHTLEKKYAHFYKFRVYKHSCSNLPNIRSNIMGPSNLKPNWAKYHLLKKINEQLSNKQAIKPEQLSLYVGTYMLTQQSNIKEIYDKFRDEDGFLYIKYGRQKDFKKLIYQPYFPILFTIAGVILFATIKTLRYSPSV